MNFREIPFYLHRQNRERDFFTMYDETKYISVYIKTYLFSVQFIFTTNITLISLIPKLFNVFFEKSLRTSQPEDFGDIF